MSHPGRTTIIRHASEHDTAMAIRETHDGVHELIIAQRRFRFGDELGGELLATREEPAKLGVGEHDGRRMKAEATGRHAVIARRATRCVGSGKLPGRTTRSSGIDPPTSHRARISARERRLRP
jgi:hypothetical protein